MSSYKELEAWKLGMKLAELSYDVSKAWPPEEKFVLRAQLIRAAISVPANIAEGMGRRTRKDTVQFLYVSRGSLYEIETLLEIARAQGYMPGSLYAEFVAHLMDTQKVLNGFIRYLDKTALR